MSGEGFARMLGRTAEAAGLGELKVHPHMLRHSAGYKIINDYGDLRLAQQHLGHKAITSTTRYTQLAPGALDKIVWREPG